MPKYTKMKLGMVLYCVLQAVDAICTHFVLSNRFGEELNPLMKFCYSASPLLFFFVKSLLSALVLFMIWRNRDSKVFSGVLFVANVGYGALAVYHFYNLFIIFKYLSHG